MSFGSIYVEMTKIERHRFSLAFALRHAGDKSLTPRIDPEPRGFQYGDSQERLFVFAREDQGAARRSALHFNYTKADPQFLFGSIGELVRPATGRPYPKSA
jgi:hypothetical protein